MTPKIERTAAIVQAAILSDLARVKALFQARALATIMGMEPPNPEPFRHSVQQLRLSSDYFLEALNAAKPTDERPSE